jgi:magnesium transporter
MENKSCISNSHANSGHSNRQIEEILYEKLEKAIHKSTSKVSLHHIAKIASEHSPIDLAYAVSHLPVHVRPILYENLPSREAKIQFVINTDSATRVFLFRQMKDKELKRLFEKMPTDEAVWVCEDMSDRRFRKVMDLIDVKKANRILELKKHHQNSAGRLMSNEFFSFNMDLTIEEAVKTIRENPGVDFTKGIFVLNALGELQGYVPARNMLVNQHSIPLRQVMRPILHKVKVDAAREEVVDLVEKYKISCLPVVDVDNFLVGVISYDDVVEAMEDLTDEAFARIAGSTESLSVDDPIFKRLTARSPWLFVTMLAGLVNGALMSLFDQNDKAILTFVLFFVPLITGMSGNIGLQCSTVLVRNMAIGMLGSNRREAIWKELISGLLIGTIFGVLTGVIVGFLDILGFHLGANSCSIGLIVGSGLIGACFAGSLLGVFSPIFFAKINVDPAIASGPIVTAFNDFLSMAIYFLIALSLGSFLL